MTTNPFELNMNASYEERSETDPCERGTEGCPVDHTHSDDDVPCEVWS